eukprot:CAMPEP_0198694114 /NCGR_PEP_ID=MMETSP1468-20131203/263325_1 /TAXON_ID=1461545 /ORGANISM="Mantoniella sp, Strain CCMP1436" /LENGTH=122 /DNA_ID=CAMNT_0044449119 /DNA_START=130 /DNA_END=494 /DNA_ORIENTATION=+
MFSPDTLSPMTPPALVISVPSAPPAHLARRDWWWVVMTCRRHALRSAAADASDTAVAAESSLVRSTARVKSQFPLMADASDRVYALRCERAFMSLGLLSDSFFIIVVFASAASASEGVASLR